MTDIEFNQMKSVFIQGIIKIERRGLSYKPQPGDQFVFVDDLKKQLEQVINKHRKYAILALSLIKEE